MVANAVVTARWWSLLMYIDLGIAMAVGAARCPTCGGRLDAGHYWRKVWGPVDAAAPLALLRWSWCCSREGCRKRVTPPSVRFWGRLGYAGAVVLALAGEKPNTKAGEDLRRLVGCARRTWARWRARFTGLWATPIGRVITGWMRLDGEQRESVAQVLSQWPGSWPYQAARWQVLIHPLTGGTNWEKVSEKLGPLDPQRMDFAFPMAELKDVHRSM